MTAIIQPQQTKYLPSLDGLRCFSILCVIITHINVTHSIISDPRLTLFVNSGLFKYGDSILLNLMGLGAIALITHYAVEKPFMRLRARYRAI